MLSTLHTNSAVESISRLHDMGIEPFLLSSSLVGIMAQRLVRKVCRDCAEPYVFTSRELEILEENGLEGVTQGKRGRGCPACNHTGYRGRMAIHEILPVDRKVKDMILNREGDLVLRDYMNDKGYHTLLVDGLLKVVAGQTTTSEILRVASVD